MPPKSDKEAEEKPVVKRPKLEEDSADDGLFDQAKDEDGDNADNASNCSKDSLDEAFEKEQKVEKQPSAVKNETKAETDGAAKTEKGPSNIEEVEDIIV